MKKIIFILIAVLLFSCKQKESDITFLSMEEYEKKYGKFSNGTISDGVPEGFAYSHDFGTGSADKAAWFVIEKNKLENLRHSTLLGWYEKGDTIFVLKCECSRRKSCKGNAHVADLIVLEQMGTITGDYDDLRGQGGVLINSTKTKQ